MVKHVCMPPTETFNTEQEVRIRTFDSLTWVVSPAHVCVSTNEEDCQLTTTNSESTPNPYGSLLQLRLGSARDRQIGLADLVVFKLTPPNWPAMRACMQAPRPPCVCTSTS